MISFLIISILSILHYLPQRCHYLCYYFHLVLRSILCFLLSLCFLWIIRIFLMCILRQNMSLELSSIHLFRDIYSILISFKKERFCYQTWSCEKNGCECILAVSMVWITSFFMLMWSRNWVFFLTFHWRN